MSQASANTNSTINASGSTTSPAFEYLDSVRMELYEGNVMRWSDKSRPMTKSKLINFFPESRRDQSSFLALLCERCMNDNRMDLATLLNKAISAINLVKSGERQEKLDSFVRYFFATLRKPRMLESAPEVFIAQVFADSEPFTAVDSESDDDKPGSYFSFKKKSDNNNAHYRNQRQRYNNYNNNNNNYNNNNNRGRTVHNNNNNHVRFNANPDTSQTTTK